MKVSFQRRSCFFFKKKERKSGEAKDAANLSFSKKKNEKRRTETHRKRTKTASKHVARSSFYVKNVNSSFLVREKVQAKSRKEPTLISTVFPHYFIFVLNILCRISLWLLNSAGSLFCSILNFCIHVKSILSSISLCIYVLFIWSLYFLQYCSSTLFLYPAYV